MQEKVIQTKDFLSKSNLPSMDYVINPYVGCPHGCVYCYASFMKRFTGHTEPWGDFVDIKECPKPINLEKIKGKYVFLSSVTDCYNPYEEKYEVTRNILKQLVTADCELSISTRNKLILRDMDLLKQMKNVRVAFSINTIDEDFRNDMDKASSIQDRIEALKILSKNGIYTIAFISPIFPYITDFKAIIDATKSYVKKYWFENLNLRGSYKATILAYIEKNYPHLVEKYNNIYIKKQREYWISLSNEIDDYCRTNNIEYVNTFYHEELVKEKQKAQKEGKEITRF